MDKDKIIEAVQKALSKQTDNSITKAYFVTRYYVVVESKNELKGLEESIANVVEELNETMNLNVVDEIHPLHIPYYGEHPKIWPKE